MDNVYTLAVEERDKLRTDNEKLAKQLETNGIRLGKLEDFLATYSQFASTLGPQKRTSAPLRKASPKGIIKVAADILADGRSRQTRELLGDLRLRGMDLAGKDDAKKVIYLSQILGKERTKNGTFVFDKESGWELSEAVKVEARPATNGSSLVALHN